MSDAAAQAAIGRARAAIELRRWDLAIQEAQRAIAAAPTDADAHGTLALALHGQKQLRPALAAVEAALALAPASEWLHRIRGLVLFDSHRLPDALAALDAALRIAPTPPAHGLRARILDRMGEIDRARDAARAGLALDPANDWLHATLGSIELHAADWRAAEAAFRAALRIDPQDAAVLNDLGVALDRQGRKEEAALAFKSAVMIDPTLTVAKANTHRTVRDMTGVVAVGAGIGVVGVIKLCAVGGSAATRTAAHESGADPGDVMVVVFLVAAVGVLIWLAIRAERRKRATNRVKELDPQLWDLFEKLERDHKAGRLES